VNVRKALKDRVRDDIEIEPYVSISYHIGKIHEHVRATLEYVRDEITKGVLFTDKSISELYFLMEKNADLINNTSDLVLARNTIILGYVREVEAAIIRSVDSFETIHEEQLIEGIAPTQSSILFVHLLNSIRSLTWHAGRIAEELLSGEKQKKQSPGPQTYSRA
jgi:Na+/phosphate symporter